MDIPARRRPRRLAAIKALSIYSRNEKAKGREKEESSDSVIEESGSEWEGESASSSDCSSADGGNSSSESFSGKFALDPDVKKYLTLSVPGEENTFGYGRCMALLEDDKRNPLYEIEETVAADIRGKFLESDVDSSELENLFFGMDDVSSAKGKRKKKRKKRKAPYSSSPGDRPRPRRKTAALASQLAPEVEEKMHLANNYYLDEKYEEALVVLREVVQAAPGCHDPFHLMGVIHETIYHDYMKAINSYLIAASIIKTDPAAWKRVGQLANKIGCKDLAIYCFRRVCPKMKDPAETDEVVAYDLACLYLDRLDYAAAAAYFKKLIARHPGDTFLSREAAKCYYNLNDLKEAQRILEACVTQMCTPERCQQIFAPYCSRVNGEDPSVENIDWPVLEMLTGLYFEQGGFGRCREVLLAVLETHFSRGVQSSEEFMVESNAIPVTIVTRLAAAFIRTRHQAWNEIGELAFRRLQRVTHENKDEEQQHKVAKRAYTTLADAYLEADQPKRALEIYDVVRYEYTSAENSEFWVKVAKCYMQLKDYEKAATFLESILPKVINSTDPQSAASKPAKDLDSMTVRVRDVEARLLLFEVLSMLEKDQLGTGAYSSAQQWMSLSTSDMLGTSDAALAVANDNRINSLIVGSSMVSVPDAIPASERQLMLLRLSLGAKHLTKAPQELNCSQQIAVWLEKHEVDRLATPKVGYRTVSSLLPSALKSLYWAAVAGRDKQTSSSDADGGKFETTLCMEDILTALMEQEDCRSPRNESLCAECGCVGCDKTLRQFFQLWRCIWIAEYIILIRDSTLDTRRILHESSRYRADNLSRQLAKEQGFLDEKTKEFINISNASSADGSSPPTNDNVDSDDEQNNAMLLHETIVLRTRPKTIDTELRRRHQRLHRGGFSHKLQHHFKLKAAMGLASLAVFSLWGAAAKSVVLLAPALSFNVQ